MSVKSKIFNYFSAPQKSELCYFVSKFVKKNLDISDDDVLEKFLEEERYYIEIDSSRHPWLDEYLEDAQFHKELKLFINENKQKYEYQNKFKEYNEKQKVYQKQQRKLVKEKKMSKEPPTKAQISYYKALCKKYNFDINTINFEDASKLDLKKALDTLLSEQELSSKKEMLLKLNSLINIQEE